MRIAVIADIHGNLPALEAVLADIASQCRSHDQPRRLCVWPSLAARGLRSADGLVTT